MLDNMKACHHDLKFYLVRLDPLNSNNKPFQESSSFHTIFEIGNIRIDNVKVECY